MKERRPGPELPYLAAFHAVCRDGGFTAAARTLGCTQPAVSYQVRALERVMRARLIERGGRRLLLTPAGERVKSLCQDFFVELERVRSECEGGEIRDPLRLSSASGFGRYVLLPALRVLQDEIDGPLELRLQFDSADVVLRDLERGESEAAFVYHRTMTNRLRYQSVYGEELVLIAPATGRSPAGRVPENISAFEGVPFVTYEEGDYVFGRWFDANFGDQPAEQVSVAHFSELEEVVDFVRRGAGYSIVPRDCVEADIASGAIVVVYSGRGQPCMNQVYMVVRSGSVVRPALRRLAALLAGAGQD